MNAISAVEAVVPTVRWSVMLPAYNCADLLRRALQSVVNESVPSGEMEIMVIDDVSSDRPEAVVDEFGGRVGFWRQPNNVGPIRNFNTCLERSSGEIIHLLHADDMVKPGFYAALDRAFERSDIGAATTVTNFIDSNDNVFRTTRSERTGSGIWGNALASLTIANRVFPPAIAVRRSVYEQLGGFRVDLPHAADWEMWSRIAANYPMWFEDRALASYRVHGGQDTSARMLSGENVRERIRAIDIVNEFVDPADRRSRKRKALGYSAVFAGRTAVDMARSGRWGPATRQVNEAARCLLRSATVR